jgi:hypothetical protein
MYFVGTWYTVEQQDDIKIFLYSSYTYSEVSMSVLKTMSTPPHHNFFPAVIKFHSNLCFGIRLLFR